uniref:Uncharacterized protein n=1 Tax=Noctiluca scintillans TaxID=2966 RepID=A0A7S1ANE3_NOCSC
MAQVELRHQEDRNTQFVNVPLMTEEPQSTAPQTEAGLPDAKVRALGDAQRRKQGASAGHQTVVFLLLALQTALSIFLVVYYNHVYETQDLDAFGAAIESGDILAVALISTEIFQEQRPSQHMKNTYTAFLSVVIALNFLVGMFSILKLNRPGIRVAILCQVTVWSTMHLQMSLDEGLTVVAGVVNLASVVTVAALFRLSDAIQEYRIGSDYTPPTLRGIFMWRVAAAVADLCLVIMGVVIIVLTNTLDLKASLRQLFIDLVQWSAAILGGIAIVTGIIGLLGNLGLRTFHSRFMLISCVALSLAVLSSACVELVWYSVAEGIVTFSCDLANHASLFGWDDDKCESQLNLFTADIAMFFLFIVTAGFAAWTNLCLSEAVQSHGIAKGEDAFMWTVGHPFNVAGRTFSRVAVTQFLIRSEMFLLWTLGVFLCAFTIGVDRDNKSVLGQLDWLLKDLWLVVGGVLGVAVCRWVGHHTSWIEPRNLSYLAVVCQVWLVGNVLNTFLYAMSTYENGFTTEPWWMSFLGIANGQYPGDRKDLLRGTAVVSGLLFASQLFALCLNFVEIESDYSLNDKFIWEVPPSSPEDDLGEA